MTDEQKRFLAAQRAALRARTRLMTVTRDAVVRLLREATRRAVAAIAAQPSDYALWQLATLTQEITRILADYGDAAGAEAARAVSRAWAAGEDAVDGPLRALNAAPGLPEGGARVVAALPRLDTRQLAAMRTFMVGRIKDIGVQAAQKITAELGLVVIGAQAPSAAISAVTEILGEPSRARATTIIRTELGRVFAVAAHERMVQAAERVPELRKQWRASGKVHARPHHDVADGQVRAIEEPYLLSPPGGPVRLMFPHDPAAPAAEVINCGCVSLAWKADWPTTQVAKVETKPAGGRKPPRPAKKATA